MRAVIQRVSSASVTVDSQVVSCIGRGLLVLVGIANDDTPSDTDYIVRKILSLKLFPEGDERENGKGEEGRGGEWKRSVRDIQGEVLCVSQFTLLASTSKSKPSFHAALPPSAAQSFYGSFLSRLRAEYSDEGGERVKDGVFGAMMKVESVNEGPVTVILESERGRSAGPVATGGLDGPGEGASAEGKGKGKKKGKSGSATPATPAEPARPSAAAALSAAEATVPGDVDSELARLTAGTLGVGSSGGDLIPE